LDDRGRCRAIEQESVEEPVKLFHRRDMDLEDEAVVAGDSMALDNFGDALGKLSDPR
jgi:hypothetical protein